MSSLTIPNNDNIDDETPTTPVQRVLNENNTNYYCTNDAINLNSNINQYESDSIVERVIYIQNWYRKYNKLLVLKEKLLSIHDITVNISNLLQKLKNSEALSSFDEAQAALLSERSSKHFTNFLSILPSDPNMKDPKKGRNFRMISSALLIAKYPSEILLSDGTIDQSIETRNCYFTASILFNSLLKFVNTIISASQDKSKLSLRKFRSLLINYRYSCRSYLDAFEIWRVIDGERVVRTLEESLYQSYSVLIATKASILFDNADPSLQPVAELQVEKIKATIVKVLGPHKSVARIEEITASIEASMPQFEMIKQYEDRLNGTIKKEKAMIMAAEAKDHSSATDQTKVSEENNVGMDAETEERMKEGIKLRDIIFTIDAKTQHSFAGMLPSVSASSATSAAAGSTSSDETTNSLLLEQSKSALVLRKVSDISGLSNERLAYEITLNKYYRIPTDIDPEIGDSPSTSNIIKALKKQMIQVISEQMVQSLLKSPINSISELFVGMTAPIYYDPTGKEALSPAVQAVITHLVKGTDDNGLGSFGVVGVNVQYQIDQAIENNVPISRIKLAADPPNPVPFLRALEDLCNRIASLTPNRKDLHEELFKSVDFALLHQMISNSAMDPINDLLPVLSYLQNAIQSLQAPDRVEKTKAWVESLRQSFHNICDNSLSTPFKFNLVVPLLPEFFENSFKFINEIELDAANYYISLLVPTMQEHGAGYIANKFKDRVISGDQTLFATSSLILSQLYPKEEFKSIVADLIEAGACEDKGFELTQLNAYSTNNDYTLHRAICARAFISLLQLPLRLETPQGLRMLPETFSWDGARLSHMRDLIDLISLETSFVITSKQLLANYQVRPQESDEIELQHRLDVLLKEKDSRMPTIITEMIQYVKFCIHRARDVTTISAGMNYQRTQPALYGNTVANTDSLANAVPNLRIEKFSYDERELSIRVEKAIKDVLAPENPILSLFMKRVYKILLRVLVGQPYSQKLSSYSLNSRGQERNLRMLLGSAMQLFDHSMNVYQDVYREIIRNVVEVIDSTTDSKN